MPKQYPAEIRERAVRLVREAQQHPDTSYGAPARIAQQLGINADTLRGWLKQADIDGGARPGVTTSESARIAELERENRELKRANQMADSSGGRNECCEIEQEFITGGIRCRANMGISVVSKSSSRSVFIRNAGSPEAEVATAGGGARTGFGIEGCDVMADSVVVVSFVVELLHPARTPSNIING